MSLTNEEQTEGLSGAQLLLAQKKQRTEMKLSIVTNCESVIQSPEVNMPSLRELTKCFEASKYMSSKTIRSLLIASLCVVYKDILPAYRIRPLTEQEKSQPICRAIHLFARKKSYRFRPAVAKALSLVPITEVVDEAAKLAEKVDRSMKSRRERKKDKLERKHEKEMAETVAAKSHEERVKLNTLILNEILFVYFKVLKTTSNSELLSSVLEGLSVYSNLINVVYVDSLLSILNQYIEQKDTKLADGLNCVHTALNILNNPVSTVALQTDPTRFYNHLYALLGRMSGTSNPPDKPDGLSATLLAISSNYGRSNTPASQAVSQMIRRQEIARQKDPRTESDIDGTVTGSDNLAASARPFSSRVTVHEAERLTDVLLSCLHMLLVRRRRDVSINRVLAFVKRLSGAALTMVGKPVELCGILWLFLVRSLLFSHSFYFVPYLM
ncbi:unnamed protein product [Echinostoma caproni]|uniref:NOC3-like protein n=1 Tax=Echinostoma caproni TaxID=27848 RepID=A0A182ZZC9_9TREM|nr:unnamed protein product [Echinostoma caproni]